MKPRSLGITLLALLFGSAVHANTERLALTPEEIQDLRAHRSKVENKLNEVADSHKLLATRQGEISSQREIIRLNKAADDKAKAHLAKLNAIELDAQGTVSEDKLQAARADYGRTSKALAAASTKLNDLESQLTNLNATAIRQNTEFDQLRRTYEDRVDVVVDRQVEERIRRMQVSKTVETTGVASCEEVKVSECKQLSLKNAELKASEMGSVVVVDSLTEVKNFKLTKEELRSEVRATLSNKEVLKQQMINDSTAFETKIRATVVPAIGTSLRQELKGATKSEVIARVGGPLNYSVAKPISLPSATGGSAGTSTSSMDNERTRLERERLDFERQRLEQDRQQYADQQKKNSQAKADRDQQNRDTSRKPTPTIKHIPTF